MYDVRPANAGRKVGREGLRIAPLLTTFFRVGVGVRTFSQAPTNKATAYSQGQRSTGDLHLFAFLQSLRSPRLFNLNQALSVLPVYLLSTL